MRYLNHCLQNLGLVPVFVRLTNPTIKPPRVKMTTTTTSAGFLLFIGLVSVFIAAVVIYRFYFSPLAQFPGPKLAGLSFSSTYILVALFKSMNQ
jgi:hypothetical protein